MGVDNSWHSDRVFWESVEASDLPIKVRGLLGQVAILNMGGKNLQELITTLDLMFESYVSMFPCLTFPVLFGIETLQATPGTKWCPVH